MNEAFNFVQWLENERKNGDKAQKHGKTLSYAVIARDAEIDASYLWRVCNDRSARPSWACMKKIANYFDTPLWVIVKEIEEGLVCDQNK